MAFSKVWTVPIAARQDPAAPITTGWGNDTWDNIQYLLEYIGADYTAGAAPNHNHDGVNSAKVNIFPGIMPNGSFEELSGGLPIGWTATEFTGGTVATTTAQNANGDTAIAITSTVLANGGGSLIQDEYRPITAGREYPFEIYRFAGVAGVSCAVQIEWYDKDLAHISTSAVFSDASTPTSWTLYSGVVTAPGSAASAGSARYARVKLLGGVPATGTSVGTVFFDGGVAHEPLVADSIQQWHIASGAVHTAELSTSTATTSTTSAGAEFVMAGGMYVFAPQVKTSGGTVYAYGSYSTTTSANVRVTSTSYVTAMSIGQITTGPTISAQWRYINTSPPYDLGDGEIPLFAFAQIDNATGDIVSVSLAPDPVWVHNGPTNCCPDGYENGKAYQLVRELPVAVAGLSLSEKKLAAMRSIPKTKRIITQQQKHADMDLIPHPFIDNDLTGTTVVMLDPVSGVVEQLAALMADGEDVNQIIHDKYLTIGNTALQRHGPAGLLIPSVKWK